MTPASPMRYKGKPVRASGNIFSIPKRNLVLTPSYIWVYLYKKVLHPTVLPSWRWYLEGKPKRSPETLPQMPDSLDNAVSSTLLC